MEIDHLLIAVPDLERAAVEWEERGFPSLEGGLHPQWGTGNRLIPLANAYVELIGVVDEDRAAETGLGQWVTRQSADGERLAGLVLRASDFDGTCDRLSLAPIPGTRERPDGGLATWRLAGIEAAIVEGLPAFIEWSDPDPRLATGSGEIELIEFGDGEGRLRGWLGEDVEGLRILDGPTGPRRAKISSGDARVEISA
ncbi:MAG TPA: VOC family protein [Rubrobacter sp.]|nr:VOC family protein [Rubrobacter sp.]